jgi:hypothetical protein
MRNIQNLLLNIKQVIAVGGRGLIANGELECTTLLSHPSKIDVHQVNFSFKNQQGE